MVFLQTYHQVPMIKKLSAVGNSLGLIIERPILELLDITKDTPIEVKTDGEALIIRPIKLSKKERIRESTKRMIDVHSETPQEAREVSSDGEPDDVDGALGGTVVRDIG